jgi:signal transduction histidine kinase
MKRVGPEIKATPPLEPVPRSWPVLVALGLVTLLLLSILVANLLIAGNVANRTAEIVDDEQRSIELVDDLREQAERLTSPSLHQAELLEVVSRIAADARAYDALSDPPQPGEREEWKLLQYSLEGLQAKVKSGRNVEKERQVIGRSIDHLVQINREASHRQTDAIRQLHHRAMVINVTIGGLTLALVATIVYALLRVLKRQRSLIERHIGLLGERNRELDAFAGRAAHDLRVPLNPIRGYADLLLTGNESPDEVRTMAARIRIAVDRMSRIVDDMLELSRAGKAASGEASPAKVGAEVLEELAADLIDAEVRASLTDERVACAPGVLAQILRNLVTNSIKFRSPERKLHLQLTSKSTPAAIELAIEDNGIGMDDESADHAFEPYYRGRTDREVPGHGLGLAIVHRATTMLGGRCDVAHAGSQGTRITVSLPRAVS